jgi:hypothetical protein
MNTLFLRLKRIAAHSRKLGNVIDFSKKLEEKKTLDEQSRIKDELNKSSPVEPDTDPDTDDLSKARERKFHQQVQEKAGVWMHRFSSVRKDADGFYILRGDNVAGKDMKPGDVLADYAINQTPYWEISAVNGDRIELTPIPPNPFATGVGAGGAKITDYDVSVLTGEHEKKRFDKINKALEDGVATIDDVIYLLDGTVPTRMGPNGAEGGWYQATDTYSNRGGRKGMEAEEIMVADANKLKDWGFMVPVKALDGTLEVKKWNDWLGGNGSDATHVPKDLDKYIDFKRKMTEKGKYRYSDDDLASDRRKYSVEAMTEYWNTMAEDFLSLSKEEMKEKYYWHPETLKGVIESGQREVEDVKKRLSAAEDYLTEVEDLSDQKMLQNVFHPERRISIANTIRLIDRSAEDESYLEYLKDILRLGGASDYFANEKIINHFELIDDVEGLQLAAEHLTDPENLTRAYRALMNLGYMDYAKERLDILPMGALGSLLNRMTKDIHKFSKSFEERGTEAKEFKEWVVENGILERITKVLSVKDWSPNYFAAIDALGYLSNVFGLMPSPYRENYGLDEISQKIKTLRDS